MGLSPCPKWGFGEVFGGDSGGEGFPGDRLILQMGKPVESKPAVSI